MRTIRELRQARGWTQFELALRVGVQPQTIYLWESGRRTPQVPQVRRLGQVFGLCSDEIELGPIPGGKSQEPVRRGRSRHDVARAGSDEGEHAELSDNNSLDGLENTSMLGNSSGDSPNRASH